MDDARRRRIDPRILDHFDDDGPNDRLTSAAVALALILIAGAASHLYRTAEETTPRASRGLGQSHAEDFEADARIASWSDEDVRGWCLGMASADSAMRRAIYRRCARDGMLSGVVKAIISTSAWRSHAEEAATAWAYLESIESATVLRIIDRDASAVGATASDLRRLYLEGRP